MTLAIITTIASVLNRDREKIFFMITFF